jgi:hypothetical protein
VEVPVHGLVVAVLLAEEVIMMRDVNWTTC